MLMVTQRPGESAEILPACGLHQHRLINRPLRSGLGDLFGVGRGDVPRAQSVKCFGNLGELGSRLHLPAGLLFGCLQLVQRHTARQPIASLAGVGGQRFCLHRRQPSLRSLDQPQPRPQLRQRQTCCINGLRPNGPGPLRRPTLGLYPLVNRFKLHECKYTDPSDNIPLNDRR